MRAIFTDGPQHTMHNMIGQIDIDHEQHQQHQHEQDPHYGSDAWAQISPNYPSSHHQSPIHEYQSFQYIHGLPHSLPVEPTFGGMPAPRATTHAHQQLLPLIMPSHPTWPSMLTNPVGYQVAPLAIPPHSAPLKPAKLSGHAPPRKTLTDKDRRRMCQYHMDNPNVKQTEIGAMFGVERSTVSKVLRQKDKFLFPEDRSSSPVKRAKGKLPDLERALSSWVRNSRKNGLALTDAAIKEKARRWATTVGDSDSHLKANSPVWLENFKQRNNVAASGKLSRRASETNISDNGTLSQDSAGPSASQTPSKHSPGSPGDMPSPLSGPKNDETAKPESMEDYMNFGTVYRNSNSQSSTSLSSAYTDTAAPSFSGGPASPSTPFAFSPETTQGPFVSPQYSLLPPPTTNYSQRPRSQTFPMLNIDPSYAQNPDNVTPKFHPSVTAPSSALDPPTQELHPPFTMDSAISPPALHHRSSNGSIPPLSSTSTGSGLISPPTGSSPSSPTQDDARRAIETLLSYMNIAVPQGLVDQNEYMTVVKLSERMRQQSLSGPGGLHRIPEQDVEVAAVKMEHSMSVEA